jgi:AAA+ ATPase superfamily predicted ATPase
LAGLYGYVRLPLYVLELFWTWWLYRQAKAQPGQARRWLRWSPVYWDELIFYPLPLLDRLLLLALRADRATGLQEATFIAHSFRQGWAANQARLAFAAEMLANCRSPETIASAPAELEWLADEVMIELQQGTGEIVPRLLAIANGVKTTVQADHPYSRRLGYREALDALDLLQQRLPSLGIQPLQRWQPAIDRWQQTLLDALDNVLATTALVTATENPYQPGNPLQLTRKELFKGRKELRDAVVNALLERNRPTLVLQGPRRMGKTSFLLQLPALLPGQTLPVFLDLQRPVITQSTAAFLFNLARTISRDARPYRLLLEPPQRAAFDETPFEAFAAWLEDVALPSLQGFNLLLTLDEFEKLGEAVEAGRLDIRIFDELRYLIQHQTQLALLFAGVQTLDELGASWSSYFINIKPLTISYLNPAEAEELIRQPDPGADFRLSYEEAVVAGIIEQTGCQPYLLQLVCSAIVEEANAQARLHVSQPVLEAALVRALDQGEPYFRNVWDEMAGPEGQPLLQRLASLAGAVALPDSPALARMVRRRVVSRNGDRYQVEVPLVRRWVAERAPQT